MCQFFPWIWFHGPYFIKQRGWVKILILHLLILCDLMHTHMLCEAMWIHVWIHASLSILTIAKTCACVWASVYILNVLICIAKWLDSSFRNPLIPLKKPIKSIGNPNNINAININVNNIICNALWDAWYNATINLLQSVCTSMFTI
jgi:hypothetical protein